MAQYDVDEVCQFLEATGLSQCVEWAKSEEMTGDLLVDDSGKVLSDENLSGLGLDSSFYCLKLLVYTPGTSSHCHKCHSEAISTDRSG